MQMEEKIAKCIKSERKYKKLSQKELAELINQKTEVIRKIEKGKYELTSVLLYDIAQALKIDMVYLLEPRKLKPYYIHWCHGEDLEFKL